MPSAPDLTYHSYSAPYLALSRIGYIQSKMGGGNLPVLHGENSNPFYFRLYNNFARNSGIASAINVQITTYDDGSTASHTAMQAVASQSWLHLMERGFGENSVLVPDRYTRYDGVDTAVGGDEGYIPEKGSDGDFGNPQIRAGQNTNGAGFIELKSYISVPEDAVGNIYPFVISCVYEWSS